MVAKNKKEEVKRIKRGYRHSRVTDEDMLNEIPLEYRCDPFEISPDGDIFWADKRNVEKVKKAIESKNKVAIRLKSSDDITEFLNSL